MPDAIGSPAGSTLDRRALSRATLARQLLLDRVDRPALEVVEHLVGMQAQIPSDPYVAMWSRVRGFAPDELSAAVRERRAVRGTLMRGTIHLVSAPDARVLRPLLQPVVERLLRGTTFWRGVAGVDVAELLAMGRAAVEERPLTRTDLREILHERWPALDPNDLVYTFTYLAPLVQVTPRGEFGASAAARFTTLQHWLGTELAPPPDLESVVLRYLGAFGPATPGDAQVWSGLTGLRAAFERLRPQLLTFRDEAGRELFDLPEAPRPGPEVPAPVRFLPVYDNLLLSHRDRSRSVDPRTRSWFATSDSVTYGSFLVDGFVAGRWKAGSERDRPTLTVEPLHPLSGSERAEVESEGTAMLRFLHAGSADGEVRLMKPAG